VARGGKKEDQTGDGGAREEEVSQAQQEFDAMHEKIELGDEAGLVVRNATDWVIELFKHRPKPWDQLSQIEQRDLVAGIEGNVHELVRMVVEAIARTGRDAVRCQFVGFTDKGDDIKAELKVKSYSREEAEQAVVQMHRARGKIVLVTVASADEFHDEANADRSEPDQPDLGFDAGTDEHPADDSDLAGSDPENLRHGDKAAFAGASGTVRIDLKRGWVQFLDSEQADLEGNWQDMREAKPAELAAERERTADFGDEDEQEAEAEPVEA
jgi:hypothetical protein